MYTMCNLLVVIQSRLLAKLKQNAFENIVEKGENAGNQHFLLFPQRFLLIRLQTSIFESHLFCRQQIISILSGSKILKIDILASASFQAFLWHLLKVCCIKKARKRTCITDRHDMTLAVKLALNPNSTNQHTVF